MHGRIQSPAADRDRSPLRADRVLCGRTLDTCSLPVFSEVPQGSVLGTLLSKIFISDLCNVIWHSKYLLFADDVKFFLAINSVGDGMLMRSDTERAVRTASLMKLNVAKLGLLLLLR